MTVAKSDNELPKPFILSDLELIDLYRSKLADDPDVEPIANEMESRGNLPSGE